MFGVKHYWLFLTRIAEVFLTSTLKSNVTPTNTNTINLVYFNPSPYIPPPHTNAEFIFLQSNSPDLLALFLH